MKKILHHLSTDWYKYLLELIVITAGVLGAFALSNWNENRLNTIKRDKLVQSLATEFRANREQIEEVLYWDKSGVKTSLQLIKLIKNQEVPPIEIMDSIMNNVSALWTFDPSNGALRSAISSGDVHLLENSQLIEYLFSWEDLARDARENEDRFISYHLRHYPKFHNYIRVANHHKFYDSIMPASYYASDYEALLKDPHFENYLADMTIYTRDAATELEIVRDRIDEILILLQK